MAFLVSICAVIAFATVLWRLDLLVLVRKMPEHVMTGIGAMFDAGLDDQAKELAVQQSGVKLLLSGARLLVVFAAALIAAAVPIYAAQLLGLSQADAILALMLRLDYILAVSVAAVLVVWLINRWTRPPASSQGDEYSSGDRMLHTMAFASPGIIQMAANFDDKLYAKPLEKIENRPPVFITSLARGGTTAVLNALHDLPQFATHRYRDMPFVGAPLTWSRLSGRREHVARQQRAHGDGMDIDLDSPEAFDEVFWMLKWPDKYKGTRIGIWTEADANPAAGAFLQRQYRKITLLRRPEAETTVAYLSKNNANIARLRLLPTLFPGCKTVIPLRGPAAHAASLHRQHLNFAKLHAKDDFGQRYMRDIGHFEFGALHKPIDFAGFDPGGLTPQDPDYWLMYWIGAFEDVASTGKDAIFVPQDALRVDPDQVMHGLLDRLGLPATGSYTQYFRRTPDVQPVEMFSPGLLAQAQVIYDQLKRLA